MKDLHRNLRSLKDLTALTINQLIVDDPLIAMMREIAEEADLPLKRCLLDASFFTRKMNDLKGKGDRTWCLLNRR